MGDLDFEYLQAGAWTLAEVTQVARAVDGMREVADAVALDVEVEPPAIAEARSAAYEYSAVPARSVAILGPRFKRKLQQVREDGLRRCAIGCGRT